MTSGRKALCVGIDRYENYPGSTLRGCANDASEMAAVLRDVLKLAPEDVVLLRDAEATKARIMSALASLLGDAASGRCSYIFFSLACYGSLAPGASSDEPDNLRDAFCPHDLARVSGGSWDERHIITEDELYEAFAKAPASCTLEVLLDTCYSGTGLRSIDSIGARVARFIPAFSGGMSRPPTAPPRDVLPTHPRAFTRSLLDRRLARHVFWKACRANQTSNETAIDGTWRGVFSYHFCREMRSRGASLSRVEVLREIATQIKAAHFSQVPQLDGDAALRRSPLSSS